MWLLLLCRCTPQAPEPAVEDPLGPPYAACTKAAALACLKHLAHNKQAAALLASHRIAAAAIASPRADGATATAQQRTQEQQQQQHAVELGSSAHGASMIKQVLLDVQQLGAPYADSPADGAAGHNISDSPAAVTTDATAQQQPPQQLHVTASLLEDAAGFIEGLVANLEEQQLLELPLAATLQVSSQAQCRSLQIGKLCACACTCHRPQI